MRRLAFGVLVTLTACVSAPPEVRTQVANAAAIGVADVREWGDLTSEEKEEAHWKTVRVLQDLNYSLNDVPVPPPFDQPYQPSEPREED